MALLPLTAALVVATGCSNGTMTTSTQQSGQETGPAFLVGTDAPLASVVSFQVTLDQVELTGTSGSTVSLVNGTPTVDFARYNGLQTLVDMNDVPTGTYTGVKLVLGTGTVGYLNTGSGAPTIATATAAFSNSTITVSFANPLNIGTKMPPVGVRMDFDLAKSIQVDSSGQIELNSSGDVEVNPTFDISSVAVGDGGAHIDELIGGLVTAPTNTTEPASFVIQGPHGENFTINTTSSTEWDGGSSLSELVTDGQNAVVAVAGTIDPSDQTLDADEVAILTDSKFYADGLVTYVTPALGQATAMDFYVRGVEPSDLTNIAELGTIADVTITGNENYGIYWMHNAFTNLLFNASALTPGQEIAVGGPDPTASPFEVKRIHLRNWGYNGTIVAGSQNSSQGTFVMKVTGFPGTVISSNVTVYLGPACDFRYGLGAFSDLTDNTSIRVVGLLLKNQSNGQLVLVARHIDGFTFTDMTATAWQ